MITTLTTIVIGPVEGLIILSNIRLDLIRQLSVPQLSNSNNLKKD